MDSELFDYIPNGGNETIEKVNETKRVKRVHFERAQMGDEDEDQDEDGDGDGSSLPAYPSHADDAAQISGEPSASAEVQTPVLFGDAVYENITKPSECDCCSRGFSERLNPTKNPDRYKMWKIYLDNIGHTPLESIAKEISLHWKKYFYEPTIKIEKYKDKMQLWPEKMVYDHLKHHVFDVKAKLIEEIRDVEGMCSKLKRDELYYKTEGSNDDAIKRQSAAVRDYEKLIKLKLQLLNMLQSHEQNKKR